MAGRVLGNYGSFAEGTRTKVLHAAQLLNYRPNVLARSLRSGRTRAIGVVVSNIVSYHWTTFIQSIEDAAAKRGYQVILGTTEDNPDTEEDYLVALYQRNVDGIILSPAPENEGLLSKLAAEGLPIVLVESNMTGLNVPLINVDNELAAKQATTYLLELGHTKIGLVAGSQNLPSGRNRLKGYLGAFKEAGITIDKRYISFGEYRFDKAYTATKKLMSLEERPTALLICNESMTGAALQCLKDLRIKVRDDVSLLAFDDPAWTSFFTPSITTVRTPRKEVATLALGALLDRISNSGDKQVATSEHLVATELVVRESTGPPNTL
jgi:LacI family transcriptional regulator